MPQSLTLIHSHFETADPVLHPYITHQGVKLLTPELNHETYFHSLCRDIVGQQLSTKVAQVIFDRFVTLFPDSEVKPEAVLKMTEEELRKVGLSGAKIRYLKDLAMHVTKGTVNVAGLAEWEDEVIITELTKVKGIGRWTAEMFLIFTLGREDIFSIGDLGLRRAIQSIYSLSEAEVLQKADEMSKIWMPYRSYASLALWGSLDNAPQKL